jgi:hypothetical protein
VQIESQALRVHAPELAAQSVRSYHVVFLQTSTASPYDIDIKVISTINASIFANSAALAGTSRTVRAKPPLMRPSLQPRHPPPPSRRKAFVSPYWRCVRRYSRQ